MTRPVLYPLRAVDTATVRYSDHPHGRRRVTIDHRPLAGITPTMLLDWFTHLGGTIAYGGEIIDRYLAWHPIDHINWELARPAPGGGAAEGARFRMVEAFGGRPEYKIDEIARVEKLDETGIRLVKRIAGIPVFQLEHTWSAGSGRCALCHRDGPRRPVRGALAREQGRAAPLSARTRCAPGSSTTSKKSGSWNICCRN